MPIFEYRCPRCGHVFERFWRGREQREELRCPQCGEAKVEKLVSAFGRASGSPGPSCAPAGGG